jgi:integrase
MLRRIKIPDICFHELHHLPISFFLDLGMPIKTVQQRAGHSKASVTADTYGNSLDRSQEEAAENAIRFVLNIAGRLQSK